MENIKYSIIIPHYNTPDLLLRCVNSIPERNDIQVIIVDDNTPNAEKEIAQYPRIFRSNVSIYFTKEGKGAGFARNEGLKHIKGKWVLFADADDFFVEGFFDIVEKYYSANVDIIFFNIKSVMSDDITKPAHRTIFKEPLFEEYDRTKDTTPFRYKYVEPWGKMIRYKLIHDNNIKFDETKVSNDYYFSVVSGCLADKVLVVNRPLYVATLRRDSLCYKFGDTLEKLLIRLDVATRVQLFCIQHGQIIKPMPIRGLMVLLLKKNIFIFIKQLFVLKKKGISITRLIWQILNPAYMNFRK